jgi:hypothetical protein
MDMRLKNINGYLVSSLNLKEAIEDKQKKIIATGLLLPKGKISRNGIMYDWESIKDTYNQIKGLKLMYNHETEGLNAIPIGHATNAWIKEEDDDEGIAGLYYEADLDPEHPQTRKILRGDLDNVSLQINAEEVTPKYDKQFGEYQLAKVSDWLEMSIVPVSGYKDATIEARIAEAYKKKNNLKEDHMKVGDVVDAGGKKMQVSQVLDNGYLISYLNETESVEDEVETKTEEINTTTAVGAVAPTKMIDNDSDKEEDKMSKIRKKEELQKTPEEEVTKVEEVVDDEEVIDNSIMKEEYEDDMTKVVEALEALKNDNLALREELDSIKAKLPQEEIEKNVEEDKEVISDSEDTENEVVPDQKTDEIKEESTEDSDEDLKESEDEEEVEEPIPPITEKSKLNKALKERNAEQRMSFSEAISGFAKERLKL